MATTAVGNPYVESSDLVANYPGVSETLAERIDVVGVNPFADAAARTTAIPSPVEGQMSSLADTDTVERYNGSAWVAVGPGKILQVVSATTTTPVATTSATYVTTGITATITPSSASSKVLIICNTSAINATTGAQAIFTIFRGTVAGTNLGNGTAGMGHLYAASTGDLRIPIALNFLDSPSTTSAQVYTIGMYSGTGSNTVTSSAYNALSSIILMEVAA